MEIQRKLIGYSGATQDGNDYTSKDGELAVCQGVVNEDGGLRRVVQGGDIGLALDNGECVYLHRNVVMGKHYIVLRHDGIDGSVLDWYDGETLSLGAAKFVVFGEEDYAAAAAIGNILIITTDKKKYYCLWKDGAYSVLGNDLPEIDIQFTTHGYFGSDGKIVNNLDNVLFEDKTAAGIDAATQRAKFKTRQAEARWESLSYNITNYAEWPGNHWEDTETASVKEDESYNDGKNWPRLLTDKCYNLLNGVIKEAKEQGLFVMPTLIRAAWRLYDGSYAKFTAPVLVFNNGTHHLTALEGMEYVDGTTRNISASIYPYTIDYYLANALGGSDGLIAKWGDMIKGISFFASSEVYDYDQQGEITTLRKTYTKSWVTPGVQPMTLYNVHYYAELPRPSVDAQLMQLRNGGPFYTIYDKELNEASTRYVLLQLKRVVNGTPGEDMPTRIGARLAAFEIRYSNSASQLVSINIASGDTLDNIAKKIEDELRRLGLKIRVSRMYAPKARAGKKTYTRELGLALVPMEDVSLDILSFGTDTDSTDTLDIFAVNCYGSPLPSESLPLKTLETQTHINDDYLQHVDLLPRVMAAYNNRLNMGNLEVKYRAYPCAINNAGWYQAVEPGSGYLVVKIWYYIKTGSGDVIVSSGDIIQNAVLHYLYYPDKRCYKAVVEYTKGTYPATHYYLQVPMKPSDLLNGAVFIDRMPYYDMVVEGEEYVWRWHWKDELAEKILSSFTEPIEVNEGVEELKNVVLTTHTDNPLNWDASLETSVGNGEILATAPNTRALSEGQYGQHPMYAFTTDEGVWALRIGSDGKLTAEQAVTRDTLTDKKSILQLDTSILFGTDRGIMELAGSKSACMTDRLTGKGFDVTQLKGYATLLEAAGMTLDELPSSSADFRQFVRGCRMAYDYINQRIYVWNPKVENNSRAYNYAYIYSIKGKSWGVIGCTLKEPLNTYPESLVTTDDRRVVKIGADEGGGDSSSSSSSDNIGTALIVTRPLKVDSLDGLKTLYEVWQRGMIRPADDSHWVKQALYGSRDMYNWRLVGSSNTSRLPGLGGSPYKYYRVAVVASMGDDEFLEGCEICWRPKHNKSLR